MEISIKTEADIKALRRCGALVAMILDELEAVAVPGNTTLDIDDRAMELITEYGAEPVTLGYHPRFAKRAYPAATCVSINDVLVHGIPNEHPTTIENGDVVSLDLVLGLDGMITDSARTVVAGEPSKEAANLLAVTREALAAGVKAVKPGNRVRDVGRAIEAVVPKGYGIVEDLAGHGVGYAVHEPPNIPNFVMRGESPEFVPGMVVAIEPMITTGSKHVVFDKEDGYTVYTADGSLGAHMEHTILVTKHGHEVLTTR